MQQHVFNIASYTRRNIFLTGKAGTGKTTFLNDFTGKTTKKYIIVAPTGIAAINAGGVTIHSMFGLPLTTFVPTYEDVDLNECINIPHLLPHFKYRSEKLKLLRSLDIMIIDEVSMLRADLLDMVDLALKTARRSALPFGGVQLLMVGDLFQLPPVVKPTSERLLANHYNAPYFFESKALNSTDFLTVELQKVYRQTDARFISLLNAIRNGDKNDIDFELLNSRYQPNFEPQDDYIYLVTHNHLADSINTKKLADLPGKSSTMRAVISGDFKEHLFPNDPALVLKPDAQVMFIRNDTSEEKQYYNGMLAKVLRCSEDTVTVRITESQQEISVEREVWENKKYLIDDNREIKMEVAGSYEQFPFRLAWAVTIHKSQGLTFDRVIIDAGRSFSSGQVYVALSRCRTLEGIVLKSPIGTANILRDERIGNFHQRTDAAARLEDIYENEKNDYAIGRLLQEINISDLVNTLDAWITEANKSSKINTGEFSETATPMHTALSNLEHTYLKFEKFLTQSTDWPTIEAKSIGAVHYFFNCVNTQLYTPLCTFYHTTRSVKGLKAFNNSTRALLDDIKQYLERISAVCLLDKKLYAGNPALTLPAVPPAKASHLVSLDMLQEGKTPAAIAAERNITIGTVFGHFAKAAASGILDIEKLFSEEKLRQFREAATGSQWKTLSEAKAALPAFEFHELRVLTNHFSAVGLNRQR